MIGDFIRLIIGLVLIEALLKPLVVYLTQRQVRRFVPMVLEYIDGNMPNWLSNLDGEELKKEVIDTIFYTAQELDEKIDINQAENILNEVVSRYSFLVNADTKTPF